VTTEPAYLLFAVQVREVTRLTPSFVRITFTGNELDWFADNGDDQRIKVVLPGPSGDPLTPPDPLDESDADGWYSHWLSLPEERRNPMRTYTVRQVRSDRREVDVDFVLHGDGGPASRWAGSVSVGDSVQLVGPNAHHCGPTRASGWNPPPEEATLLIVGDETALPAVASILGGLPATAQGTALIEVPEAGDILSLTAPSGIRVEWVVRGGAGHGDRLSAAVRRVAGPLLARSPQSGAPELLQPSQLSQPSRPARPAQPVRPMDTSPPQPEVAAVAEPDDADIADLWDVPEPADQPVTMPVYAWLAGEAGCIAGLRRHLVKDLGLDRRAVAFMGYWRHGATG
jgi:iron complex transport system ATP-binding protein